MTLNLQAQVAQDLAAIQDMASRLEARAIDRSRDRELPGGAALVELAHVGSLETWTNRVDGLERRWRDQGLPTERMPNWVEAEDPDELWPAKQIICTRAERYRQALNMTNDEDPRWRPSLVSEAKFLRNKDVADWIWDHETRYEDYAKDVHRARAKLENILQEGDRSERTPVVCDRCDDGRPLVRVYDQRRPVLWSCLHCFATSEAPGDECPTCHAQRPLEPCRWHSDPQADRWKCPKCKAKLTHEELDDARARQMRTADPRQWVPRTQALQLLKTTLGYRTAAAEKLVDDPASPTEREPVTGRLLVSWPDVWRRHLAARQVRILQQQRREEGKSA